MHARSSLMHEQAIRNLNDRDPALAGGALEPVLDLQALWRTVSVAGLNAVQAVVLSHLSKDDPWLLIP